MAEIKLKDFRSNPNRAIYISGRIDQSLVDRLTPEILALQAANRDPITVFIDSNGGSTVHAELLLRLLSNTDQDFSEPCRLITVVTSRAYSAAADILSSGDYAIAYRDGVVLYHGVRSSSDDPLTAQEAQVLTESLRSSNDRYAMELAGRSYGRLVFRYTLLMKDFAAFRESSQQIDKKRKTPITDLECFVGLLTRRLSRPARQLMREAQKRNATYATLVDKVTISAGRRKAFTDPHSTIAQFESAILHSVIDFELAKNRQFPGWAFSRRGLSRVSDDFLLIKEYLAAHESKAMLDECSRYAVFFLNDGHKEALSRLPEESQEEEKLKIIKPIIQPVWLFFVALCHVLQEGDNELTATDAYWLGLIDEVMGMPDLVTLRVLVEGSMDEDEAPGHAMQPDLQTGTSPELPAAQDVTATATAGE